MMGYWSVVIGVAGNGCYQRITELAMSLLGCIQSFIVAFTIYMSWDRLS